MTGNHVADNWFNSKFKKVLLIIYIIYISIGCSSSILIFVLNKTFNLTFFQIQDENRSWNFDATNEIDNLVSLYICY